VARRWASGAHVQWGTGTLANDEGAWEGTYTGSYSNTNGDILLFWFKGTGAYSGLSYGMWAVLSPDEVAWTYPVRGIIFPGSPRRHRTARRKLGPVGCVESTRCARWPSAIPAAPSRGGAAR
jgi:hypothetical protein